MAEIQELSWTDLRRVMIDLMEELFRRAEESKGLNPEKPAPTEPPPTTSIRPPNQAAPAPETPPLQPSLPVSGFVLGSKSKRELEGVHPILVKVVHRAIELTTQDFTVFDGVRTEAQQRNHVNQGTSKTMNSKHLRQRDGYAHAVDLVPWIKGLPKWDWEGCYKIAYAVDQAATEQGVAHLIRWGGAWDRTLDKFGGDPGAYAREVVAYANRNPGKDFLDGPHFELVGVL